MISFVIVPGFKVKTSPRCSVVVWSVGSLSRVKVEYYTCQNHQRRSTMGERSKSAKGHDGQVYQPILLSRTGFVRRLFTPRRDRRQYCRSQRNVERRCPLENRSTGVLGKGHIEVGSDSWFVERDPNETALDAEEKGARSSGPVLTFYGEAKSAPAIC